jgi:hypothetical protein
MKTLNQVFMDEEFEILVEAKKLKGDQNWHDFLLSVAREIIEEKA